MTDKRKASPTMADTPTFDVEFEDGKLLIKGPGMSRYTNALRVNYSSEQLTEFQIEYCKTRLTGIAYEAFQAGKRAAQEEMRKACGL